MNKVKLGEAVSILDSRRIPVSSAERANRDKIYPYYGAQGIVDYIDDYLFDGEYVLVAEDGNNLKSLNEPIVTWVEGKFWVNNHAHILEDCGKADIRYVYYYLMTSDLRGLITGSAQPKLNQDNLSAFVMNLPSREVQHRAASVLSAIDDKIALNKQMMSKLEETAHLIYDYWFTQFDFPDENGNPYRSSGGKMTHNKTLNREIPAGWRIVTINDLIEVEKGISYKSENLTDDGIPMISLSSFNADGTYKPNGLKRYSGSIDTRKLVKPFDLIMCVTQQTPIDLTGKTNVIGKTLLVPDIFTEQTLISTDVVKLIPSANEYGFLLHGLFRDPSIHKYIVGFANGTKIKHLDMMGAFDLKIPIPPQGATVFSAFAELASKFESKKSKLLKENRQLATLRNWLLPMLMNRQISIQSEA